MRFFSVILQGQGSSSPKSLVIFPLGSIRILSWVHRVILREGKGTPLQYSCLKNPMEEEPGGLQSMGSLRVGHNWATSLSLFTFMYWRRKWQPTPVFLPGESQGRGSLVGYCLWGRTESDTTEVTQQQQLQSDPLLLISKFLLFFSL